jgi:DNA (cytosine-5)-methyltransferase 1
VRVLDLFSCLGLHMDGLRQAGPFEPALFVEKNDWRRKQIERRYPGVPTHDDVATLRDIPAADLVVGGPPCQRSSVAAAIHDYRSGETLWPYMLHIGLCSGAEWFVVEQPPGNAAWEAEVSCSLSRGWPPRRPA